MLYYMNTKTKPWDVSLLTVHKCNFTYCGFFLKVHTGSTYYCIHVYVFIYIITPTYETVTIPLYTQGDGWRDLYKWRMFY